MEHVYTKYQLQYRLNTFANPAARMAASVDGWWSYMEQQMKNSLHYYGLDIPYWLSDEE